MKRRDFLKASALAAATGLLPTLRSFADNTDKRPNFIFIMADDLGYGDLACYGHPRNKTPHIDQLAREGLKFTDFHANGPMCSPTRAALLTGKYQNRFGRPFESALSDKPPYIGLPTDVTTIPQLLKEQGYTTGMYGKWHLGYKPPQVPTHFGFDDFRGLLTGDGDHVSHINRPVQRDWYHNEDIVMEEGYTADLITKHSIDFMRNNKDNPFSSMLPISPLISRGRHLARKDIAKREKTTGALKNLGPTQKVLSRPWYKKWWKRWTTAWA